MKKALNSIGNITIILCKVVCVVFVVFFASSYIITSCQNKYKGPQYEADFHQMIDDYAVAYGKKNDCELIHAGNFDFLTRSPMIGLWLRCNASENLQQGRARATALVGDFYNTLQQNSIAHTYYDENKRIYSLENTNDIPLKIIGIKIAYWNKEVNRPQPPYLAEITFLDKTFRYYEADPKTQALKLLHEESYDAALSQIKK